MPKRSKEPCEKPMSVRYITMATASLSTDSPNTSMLSVGCTSSVWKMANVATGSTAEMSAPNMRLSSSGCAPERIPRARPNTR